MTDAVKPPAGLQGPGTAIWESISKQYSLNPGETAILEALARTLDELERLEAAMAGQPMTVTGSQGQPRPHPLLGELRAHRALADKLQVSLALPAPGELTGRRRSGQHKAAVEVRHRRAALAEVRRSG